jgi:hypothetical protein
MVVQVRKGIKVEIEVRRPIRTRGAGVSIKSRTPRGLLGWGPRSAPGTDVIAPRPRKHNAGISHLAESESAALEHAPATNGRAAVRQCSAEELLGGEIPKGQTLKEHPTLFQQPQHIPHSCELQISERTENLWSKLGQVIQSAANVLPCLSQRDSGRCFFLSIVRLLV